MRFALNEIKPKFGRKSCQTFLEVPQPTSVRRRRNRRRQGPQKTLPQTAQVPQKALRQLAAAIGTNR
jgi:hypothetical protein